MREKVRLRGDAKQMVYQQAERDAERNVFPMLKRFLNELPWYERAAAAWLILIGRF